MSSRRARARAGHHSLVKGLPQKSAPLHQTGILSAWQIEENPPGNDLLIIVNGWVSSPPSCRDGGTAIVMTTMRPGWGRLKAP